MEFDIDKINNLEDLKKAKNEFANSSELKKLIEDLKNANGADKAIFGKQIQEYKQKANEFFDKAKAKIEQIENNKIMSNTHNDYATPHNFYGLMHPIEQISNRFRKWLFANGYFEQLASEIENDEYNFERLNIPQKHPARDMQDSLYINENELLRTHNTGVTARVLEKYKNKAFSSFTIGKVYRNDEEDMTHSHQFTQLDLISVGKHSFGTLMYTLRNMLSYVLEENVKIRLRPSYFPFTEPSVEVDVFYKNKWIEVLGAGIVHNNVLREAGYTNKMNAIAAGIGIERIAMIKYQIDDIREFYVNDLRFLKQFRK